MKNLSEQVQWFKAREARKWKRIVNLLELIGCVLAGVAIISVVLHYGDGTGFQSALILFLGILVVCIACLTPIVYEMELARWKILLIKLSFLCGIGIAALSGFLILESQDFNTQPPIKAAHNKFQQSFSRRTTCTSPRTCALPRTVA